MMRLLLLQMICFLAWSSHAAQLIDCHDGDTCKFRDYGRTVKVRFSGCDAPELKQPFGKQSRDHLKGLLRGNEIRLACEGKSYDRKTCQVFAGQIDTCAELVRAGMAWDSPKYSRGRYRAAMIEARTAKRGIWGGADPVSPHCFRHKNNQKCWANPSFMP